MVRNRTKLSAVSSATLAACSALLLALANAPPARADWTIVPNPVTENPEAVWSNTPFGQSAANILYSYLDGNSWASSTILSQEGKDVSTPVLAFDASGGRMVAWETYDTGQILMKTLPSSGGSWSESVAVSDSGETASRPWIAAYADDTWISYETSSLTSGSSVRVAKIATTGSIDRALIRTTSCSGSLRTQIHVESGHLWIDWVDSGTSVGYSEYRDGIWIEPAYESYEGEDDIKRARGDIRSSIVN